MFHGCGGCGLWDFCFLFFFKVLQTKDCQTRGSTPNRDAENPSQYRAIGVQTRKQAIPIQFGIQENLGNGAVVLSI